jgi:hypothetical protein
MQIIMQHSVVSSAFPYDTTEVMWTLRGCLVVALKVIPMRRCIKIKFFSHPPRKSLQCSLVRIIINISSNNMLEVRKLYLDGKTGSETSFFFLNPCVIRIYSTNGKSDPILSTQKIVHNSPGHGEDAYNRTAISDFAVAPTLRQ